MRKDKREPEFIGGILYNEHKRIHSNLRRWHGSAGKCENKDCPHKKTARNFEWALKKGRAYSEDITDYLQLCVSCHRKYDETEERRKKISTSLKGRLNGFKKPVRSINPTTGEINNFVSIAEAAILTDGNSCAINIALSGKIKTSGGLKWEYLN